MAYWDFKWCLIVWMDNDPKHVMFQKSKLKMDNQATTKGSHIKGPTRHVLKENSTFNNAPTTDCRSYCYQILVKEQTSNVH